MDTKRCPRCGGTKPRSEFRRGWCRDCTNAYMREWRAKNPDKVEKHVAQHQLNKREADFDFRFDF